MLAERVTVEPWVRSSLTIGFLGAYTTFSTLPLESYRLIEDGSYPLAFANAVGSLAAGLSRSTSASRRTDGLTMRIEGEGKLVRIFIGESTAGTGKPLYQAIVERVPAEGLAGATVIRGDRGLRRRLAAPTPRGSSVLSEDLPVVIEIVDSAERIDGILPLLDEMVAEGPGSPSSACR